MLWYQNSHKEEKIIYFRPVHKTFDLIIYFILVYLDIQFEDMQKCFQFSVAAGFPKEHDLPMGKVKGIGITTLGSQRTRMDKINKKGGI